MSSGRNPVQERIKANGSIYGNKSANLIELDTLSKSLHSELIRIQIPEIFPLADNTVKSHLELYAPEWRKLWDEFVKVQGSERALTDASKKVLEKLHKLIISTFETHPVSDDIINSIKLDPETQFMVRSTGEEDTVDMANPGGNKSVAAVKLSKEAISNAMGVVIASYVSEKSLTQRLLSGDDISKPSFMPVLIQRMIGEKINGEDENEIVVSGVMYAYENEVRIDAAPGHGELIVNSKAPFDTYDITPAGLVHAEVYQKDERLVPVEVEGARRKLVFKINPKQIQRETSLSPQIAKELARIGEAVASHYEMPMDIEFVYHPHDKILYLVQARPIPQDVHHKIKPSAIAPDQWPAIKKDDAIAKMKCHVVKEGGNAVKVITAANQVIHRKHIDKALKYYLKNPSIQDKIRAVIIKHDAPSTSHEAAFFNALGIPVLQASIKKIKPWLKEEKPVIVVDPQHQHLLNFSSKIKDIQNPEQDLRTENIIADGLFVSAMSASATLLPVDYALSDEIKQVLSTYFLHHEPVDKTNIYTQMLDNMNKLEDVKREDHNETAFAALRKLAEIFKIIGTSTRAKEAHTPHKALFQHALLAIAEIHLDLTAYSALATEDDNAIPALQRLLDAVAKMKALVINPGKLGLYSDSIFQIAAQNKSGKGVAEKISGEQRDYLQEFMKMKSLVLNQTMAEHWSEFVLQCSNTPYNRHLLAYLISTSVHYHFESELLNHLFPKAVKASLEKDSQAIKPQEILRDLFEKISESEIEFKKYHIKDNDRLIAAWENKIDDWSDPAKYESLFAEYEKEIIALSKNLCIDDGMQSLTQKVLLKQAQSLTDLMDKSIKSLKGSPDYTNQTELLIKRFVMMLTPYHQMMEKWMESIPEYEYEDWARKIRDRAGCNYKNEMISLINQTFVEKCRRHDARQLEPSRVFSVSSAKIGSTASFARQFCEKSDSMTLEDLFSLMHQNILSSTVLLGKKSEIEIKMLPDPIQDLLETLKQNKITELLAITHHHPKVTIEYNIPMQNHSAKLTLVYDTNSQSLQIHWGLFGKNWEGRMDAIAKAMAMECVLLNGSLAFEPRYDHATRDLECVWKLEKSAIADLTQHIGNIIDDYAELADNNVWSAIITISHALNRHAEATKNNFKHSNLIPAIQTRLKEAFDFRNNSKSDIQSSIRRLIRTNPLFINLLDKECFEYIDNDMLYDYANNMDFESIHYACSMLGDKLDLYYSSEIQPLVSKLLKKLNAAEMEQFLVEFKPDLSKCDRLLNDLLSQEKYDQDVVTTLLKHGLKANHLSLTAEIRRALDPELEALLGNAAQGMDKDSFTKWFFKLLCSSKDRLVNLPNFIEKYQSLINFDYTDGVYVSTLLVECLKLMPDTVEASRKLSDVVPPTAIDLKKQPHLLKRLSTNKEYIDYFKAIIAQAEHLDDIEPFSIFNLYKTSQDAEVIFALLDKLSPKMRTGMMCLSTHADTSDAKQFFLSLLERYADSLDFSHVSNSIYKSNLIDNIFEDYPKEVTIKYLKQYHPDLTQDSVILANALSHQVASLDSELINLILACGASVNKISLYSLMNAYQDKEIFEKLCEKISGWDSQKLENFLIDGLRYITNFKTLTLTEVERLAAVLNRFKPAVQAGFNLTNDRGDSMLQTLLHIDTQDESAAAYNSVIASIIVGSSIDFSVQDNIFSNPRVAESKEIFSAIVQCGQNFDAVNSFKLGEFITTSNLPLLYQLLDKLPAKSLTKIIYSNIQKLHEAPDATTALFERYKDKIQLEDEFGYNDKPLFEILVECNIALDAVTNYLKTHKIDLSKNHRILSNVINEKPCNLGLAIQLIKSGASFNNFDFPDLLRAFSHPELRPVITEKLLEKDEKSLNEMISSMIYNNSDGFNADVFLALIGSLCSKIDMENTVWGDTLLEVILARMNQTEIPESDIFEKLMPDKKIDISKHTNLINIILKRKDAANIFNLAMSHSVNISQTGKFYVWEMLGKDDCKENLIKLLDALPPKMLVTVLGNNQSKLYNTIDSQSLQLRLQIFERYADKIKEGLKISDEYICLFTHLFNSVQQEDTEKVIEYLKKYKPDLTNQPDLYDSLSGSRCNPEFIKILMELGASHYKKMLPRLMDKFNEPVIGDLLANHYLSWTKDEFTKWSYQYLYNAVGYYDYSGEFSSQILERFGSHVNLEYRQSNNDETYLELLIDKLRSNEFDAARFLSLIGNCQFDLSIHTNLLNIFSKHKRFDSDDRMLITTILKQCVNTDAAKPFMFANWLREGVDFSVVKRVLDTLSSEKLQAVFDILKVEHMDNDQVIRCMNLYAKQLDFKKHDTLSTTLLDKLVIGAKTQDIINFLETNKPDLHGQKGLLKIALNRQDADSDFIKLLFSCGVLPNEMHMSGLAYAARNQTRQLDLYKEIIRNWNAESFTAWFYDKIKRNASRKHYGSLMKLCCEFQSQLDFNYRPDDASATLLERFINTLNGDEMRYPEFEQFCSGISVDISKNQSLLQHVVDRLRAYSVTSVVTAFSALLKNAVNLDAIEAFNLFELVQTKEGMQAAIQLLDKLPPEKVTQFIYKYTTHTDVNNQSYLELLQHYIDIIDPAYAEQNNTTLLEKMITFSSDSDNKVVMEYLRTHTLDLSQHKQILQAALFKNPVNTEMISLLLERGACDTVWPLGSFLKNSEMMEMLSGLWKTNDKQKFSTWLYDCLRCSGGHVIPGVDLWAFYKKFKSRINLEYAPGSYDDTLLEMIYKVAGLPVKLAGSPVWKNDPDLQHVAIDFKYHPKLLQIANSRALAGDMAKLMRVGVNPDQATGYHIEMDFSKEDELIVDEFLWKLTSKKRQEVLCASLQHISNQAINSSTITSRMVSKYFGSLDLNLPMYPSSHNIRYTTVMFLFDHLTPEYLLQLIQSHPEAFAKVDEPTLESIKKTSDSRHLEMLGKIADIKVAAKQQSSADSSKMERLKRFLGSHSFGYFSKHKQTTGQTLKKKDNVNSNSYIAPHLKK